MKYEFTVTVDTGKDSYRVGDKKATKKDVTASLRNAVAEGFSFLAKTSVKPVASGAVYKNKPVKDGWIPFKATENSVCPVEASTVVSVRLVDGMITHPMPANHWCWDLGTEEDNIIAYKVEK